MTPDDIERSLTELELSPIPDAATGPGKYATHRGLLELPGMPCIRVYRLNTGERVMDAADVEGFLARMATE